MDRVFVLLQSWIIQDDNYPDFEEKQIVEFAVQASFGESKLFDEMNPISPLAIHRDLANYDIEGNITFVGEGVFIVDIGLSVFCVDSHQFGMAIKDRAIAGAVTLTVAPYYYKERYAKRPDMPSVLYKWQIESIQKDKSGPNEVSVEWERVSRTTAIHDHPFSAYILDCRRVPS